MIIPAAFNDLPDPIRRRLGFSLADEMADELRRESFSRIREYEALLLAASAGEPVGATELLDAGCRVSRSPARVSLDLQIARDAYDRWRTCVDPV